MESVFKHRGSKEFSLGFPAQDEHMKTRPNSKASSSIKREGIGILGGYDDAAYYGSDVDRRAAKFISFVQERLRLERVEEGWRK